jgi:drug/metabolite transporter (DMT)-like permease
VINARTFLLTSLAMIAFASNSLLCRAALKQNDIDVASFTFARIFSGAVALSLFMCVRRKASVDSTPVALTGRFFGWSLLTQCLELQKGSWSSAVALFIYAAAFSFAYVTLSAATGALLLFGAVQATMILWGLLKGERLDTIQVVGFIVAVAGLIALVFPGVSAPPIAGSILMLGAGVAWGIYSLRGKGERNPAGATTGNFLRAVPFAAALIIFSASSIHLHPEGILYAVISGAITSGVGYIIWYSALPELKAITAAIVQLSVPVLAATGGILLLGEPITLRYMLASIAVLGGIAIVIATPYFRDRNASRVGQSQS